ncbi:DUF1934 domain-containing protein [Virgibacillus halophilus]|uniref:DUF1934 domain-containing protein n=1 Tax=Tigheibacillus halophilus TaxID=361280 RepID=A0ABU5C4L0_9BACI|nr:DUF1934 domain-containing protein [Virgibacillus halophilus]
MGKNVIVSLQTIIDDNGQMEHHATTQQGAFTRKGQLDVLIFDEQIDKELPPVRNLMTIQKNKVNVKRTGSVNMNQQFVLGKNTENVYTHPHGSLHMQTYTRKIDYNLQSAGNGELTIEYSVKLNGQEERGHQLKLQFKEEN